MQVLPTSSFAEQENDDAILSKEKFVKDRFQNRGGLLRDGKFHLASQLEVKGLKNGVFVEDALKYVLTTDGE